MCAPPPHLRTLFIVRTLLGSVFIITMYHAFTIIIEHYISLFFLNSYNFLCMLFVLVLSHILCVVFFIDAPLQVYLMESKLE
jgi:hypothetical protein